MVMRLKRRIGSAFWRRLVVIAEGEILQTTCPQLVQIIGRFFFPVELLQKGGEEGMKMLHDSIGG
jgi:hypothetical protein